MKNLDDFKKHNWDNFAIVKDLKLKDESKKKVKKSDVFITNDNKILEPITRNKGHKNGKPPYAKPTNKGSVEMY